MSPTPRDDAPAEDESSRATDGASPLRINHDRVLARIAAAARAAGRDPGEVLLLAVSKSFPPPDVLELAACGQRAFAENYVQEALDKMAACRDRWPIPPTGRSAQQAAAGREAPQGPQWPQWHFIGPVQSNKTRAIAEHFDWVHSVERLKIAQRLSDQRPAELANLQVCVQVNVSGEATKSGCPPHEALALAQQVARLPRLRLRGLMAIPEPTDDPHAQRARFAILARLLVEMRSAGLALDTLSMGMSDDLEAAIAEGATIVRVGTALFGRRPVRPSP
jgi:PLP dependent protein